MSFLVHKASMLQQSLDHKDKEIERLEADNRFLKEELDMAYNQAEMRVKADRLIASAALEDKSDE